MADTIDNLQIEIESSSAAAVAHVDALSNALLRLKSATSGAAGLSAIAKSMSAIGSASDKLKSVGSAAGKMQTLANALNSFGRVPDLRSVGRQMTGLSKGVSDLSAAQFNADKINSISGILSGLSSVGKLQGNPGKQLKSLADGLNALGAVSLSPEKVQSITGAMQAISGIEKATGLASTIKALEKLPEISKALATADLGKFATQMQQVADAMRPLANEMQKVSAGFAAFPIRIQKIIAGNTGLAASNQAAGNSFNFLGAGIGRGAFRLGAFYLALRRTADILSDFVAKSNDYVENLNLFTVAMGDGADEALRYAETVQDAMGIDMSGFIRNQGMFKQIVTGFGVVEEKANTMSKGLVQIGYDISSFFNRPIEESMQKVQSGIAGELEPLRRLGYALDVATLAEIARKNGIEQSLNTMTQAQKSQLRYVAIMEQSGRMGVMGDMARTILTPANAMRILSEKVYQLKRAIGNALIPILIKVVPYVQAFVEVLTEAAQWIATLFGFELPRIDTSGIDKIGSSAEADKEALDGATQAAKELKNATLGIDELNVIAPQEKAGGAGAASAGGGDLGLPLKAYDFLQDLTEQTNTLKESMRGVLTLTGLIGAALLAWKFKDGILIGLKAISDLLGYTLLGKIGALTAGAVALSHALKFAGVVAVIATMVWRFNDLWDKSEKFRKGVERIGQVFSGAFGFAKIILSDIGTELKSMGMHLLNLLPESVKESILTAFQNFGDWAKSLDLDFADLAITIAGIGLLFVPGGQVLGVALLAFEGITIAIRELGGISEEEWAKMGATAHTVFTAIWDYSKTSFGGIIAVVTGTFTGDWKMAFDGLKGIAGAALDLIGALTKELFGVNIVDVVKTWFTQHVAPWLSFEKWAALGKDIVNGLISGVGNFFGKGVEWAKNLLLGFRSKDGIDSHSPSKAFQQIGMDCVNGLDEGIVGMGDIGTRAGRNLVDAMSTSITANQSLAVSAAQGVADSIQSVFNGIHYNASIDYQAAINEAVKAGNTAEAGRLEEIRNAKIQGEGMTQFQQTFNFQEAMQPTADALATSNEYVSQLPEQFAAGQELRAALNVLMTSGNELSTVGNEAATKQSELSLSEMSKHTGALQNKLTQSSNATTATINALKSAMWAGFASTANEIRSASARIVASTDQIRINIYNTYNSISSGGGSSKGPSKGSGWKPKAFYLGGFPEPGQYFRARENGPELVGTVGGRTAVANNDQIVAGIEAAVYRAMMSVAAQQTERPIVVQSNLSLDGKQVAASVENHQRQRGVGIMSGGVMHGV